MGKVQCLNLISIFVVSSTLTLFLPSTSFGIEDIALSNPLGAIGDPGNLQLMSPSSSSFHLNNNDYLGATDKLLTGSMHYEHVEPFIDGRSRSYHIYWRFLTPVFKQKFGEEDLSAKVGRFGDMASLVYGESFLWKRGPADFFVPEWAIGLDHFGNKGAKSVQSTIHQMVGSETKNLTYTDQPSTLALNPQLKISWVPSLIPTSGFYQKWGLGLNSSYLMNEASAQANFLFRNSNKNSFGLETRLIRQLSSPFYGSQILPMRYEMAASFTALSHYQITIKWVSTYLKGDAYNQTYIDFLNYVWST